MTDDELIDALRRTLHAKAEAIRPSASAVPSPKVRPISANRISRPSRRFTLASLATAGLVAAAAATVIVINDHPSPAHNVSISSQTTPTLSSGLPSHKSTTTAPKSSTTAVTLPPTPVPADFQPASVTFVSSDVGWVLGTAPCAGTGAGGVGTCLTLARSTDGGNTWSEVSQPSQLPAGGTGTSIRFGNAYDGWIVTGSGSKSNQLWSTQDGGRTWQSEADPGGPSAIIEALETQQGLIHLVTLTPGTGVDQIFTTPITQVSWTLSAATPSYGGGPTPESQLVLQNANGWIINVNRTVVGGALLSSGVWTDWKAPPCSDANGHGSIAASSTTDLFAVCAEGEWGTPAPGTTSQSDWLYASNDGGNTFSRVSPVPRDSGNGPIAAAPSTATVVAVTETGLEASFNGGTSWQSVSSTPGISYLGFETASQGVAIASPTDGSSTFLMTHDGGHTWIPVSFQ